MARRGEVGLEADAGVVHLVASVCPYSGSVPAAQPRGVALGDP